MSLAANLGATAKTKIRSDASSSSRESVAMPMQEGLESSTSKCQ